MSTEVMLSDVAEMVMGQSPPSSSYNETGEGLPFYQGKTEFGATFPTPRKYCTEPKKFAEAGDILMSVRAPVGVTNLCREKSCIGRGIAAIRATDIDRDFLYFYLRNIEPYIDSLGTGAIFKAINKSQLSELPINEAGIDLPEQKKIAHILSTVQRAIEAQERIIQTTCELKKALMQKLFTEGLRNEPQKQTELGPIPESWDVVRIGDWCDVSTGTTPSTKNPEYYVGKNPFIKTGEITNNRITSASVHISDEAIAKYNLKVYEPGTLFIAMYGQGKTRGQISILEVPASTSQNAGAIVPSSEVDSEYLWCYLMSQYEQLRRSGIEGHISHLNLGYVKQILFPKPSLSDQQKIASTFHGIDRKMLLHQKKQRVFQDLFCTLLHELMTAKIRVHEMNLAQLQVEEGFHED